MTDSSIDAELNLATTATKAQATGRQPPPCSTTPRALARGA
jgi:hypothetical protein